MMKNPIFRSKRLAIMKSSMSKLKSQLKLLEGSQGATNKESYTITREMVQTQDQGSRERFHIPTKQEISSSSKLLSDDEKNETEEEPIELDIGEVEVNVKYDTDPHDEQVEETKEELEEESDKFHDCYGFFISKFEEVNYTNMESNDLHDISSSEILQEESRVTEEQDDDIEGYEADGDEDCDQESISAVEFEKKVLEPFFDNKERTSEDDLIMQGVLEPESGLENGSDCSIGTFILVIIFMMIGPYVILELNTWLGTGISA